MNTRATSIRKIRSARGAVMVEYALLLLAFGVPVMAGLALAGDMMFEAYEETRKVILESI